MSAATSPIQQLLARLASLKLTVTLFALSMFLIFAGTLAQVEQGIWDVVNGYFRAWLVWIPLNIFMPRSVVDLPGGFLFPGGFILGGLLLVNLIAAHATRFKFRTSGFDMYLGLFGIAVSVAILAASPTLSAADRWTHIFEQFFGFQVEGYFWPALLLITMGVAVAIPAAYLLYGKRTGIVLIHVGVALLLVGELVTAVMAHESNMVIAEGSYANYTYSLHDYELAVIDPTDDSVDRVTVVPSGLLTTPGHVIEDAALPFGVRVIEWIPNAALLDLSVGRPAMPGIRETFDAALEKRDSMQAHGDGRRFALIPQSQAAGVEGSDVDTPGAYDELLHDGESLGVWLLHVALERTQRIEIEGKPWLIELRFERQYRPFSVHLHEFRHDKFIGTDKPRNFSSLVTVDDPRTGEHRRSLIKMNAPMRYDGHTFYQASFLQGDTGTVLQVVRNPGWALPYISCLLVSAGMMAHFGTALWTFLRKVRP